MFGKLAALGNCRICPNETTLTRKDALLQYNRGCAIPGEVKAIKFCNGETFFNPTPGPSPKLRGGESNLRACGHFPVEGTFL